MKEEELQDNSKQPTPGTPDQKKEVVSNETMMMVEKHLLELEEKGEENLTPEEKTKLFKLRLLYLIMSNLEKKE